MLWVLWYFALHQPMREGRTCPCGKKPPSEPAVLQCCSAEQSCCCDAPRSLSLSSNPWPLLPAKWGSCSFVPWEAGPCFLLACRFCVVIGPEACRLRRRLLCRLVPLEPIRSKNGPKLLARPTPALHRPVCGMHLPQLVTSSRPILLHLAPSPCNPRHPLHHQPDTKCNPIVPPCPLLARPALPNSACTVRAAALRMEADHPPLDPGPSPTSTNRRLLTGVVCRVPALTSCNAVHLILSLACHLCGIARYSPLPRPNRALLAEITVRRAVVQ